MPSSLSAVTADSDLYPAVSRCIPLCRQLLEVHSLLQSEGGGVAADQPAPMDTLRWVQDSGGRHLQVIHQFFQCGCDRRYHHVKLKGKTVPLGKISSCGMPEYLQEHQWLVRRERDVVAAAAGSVG